MRGLVGFVLTTLLSVGFLASGAVASAQTVDPVSCGHFDSQEAAQTALDQLLEGDLGRDSLDSDGDGIACEDATHLIVCSEFANLREAQAYVARWAPGTEFPNLEDDDGNGIFCEALFGTDGSEDGDSESSEIGPVTQLPANGSGERGAQSPAAASGIAGMLAVIVLGFSVRARRA